MIKRILTDAFIGVILGSVPIIEQAITDALIGGVLGVIPVMILYR